MGIGYPQIWSELVKLGILSIPEDENSLLTGLYNVFSFTVFRFLFICWANRFSTVILLITGLKQLSAFFGDSFKN